MNWHAQRACRRYHVRLDGPMESGRDTDVRMIVSGVLFPISPLEALSSYGRRIEMSKLGLPTD
jgi:hypothetical protein